MEQRSNPNNVRSSLENLNEIKIALLTEDSCLQNWMALLEHNLKRKEKHEWVEIALTHMNEKIISKLKNLEILLNSSNGFEKLKNQLVNIFNSSSKPFGRPKSLNDFKIFFERNQQPNYRIKTMLTEAFPKPKIEFFEDVLKQRYVKGLNNTRLREKCGEKLKNSTQINLVFSNDQNNFEYEKIFQSRRYEQHWNFYNRNKAKFDLNQRENLQVLTGTAIFNNTLASFSFDSRVGSTLTNESLYVRIKKEDPKTVLEPYNGKPIYLCDKQLYVYGQVHLRKCQLSKNFLDNELIIVTNHKSNYECNVPKLIGNYENELMSSNQNFYKRENPKGENKNPKVSKQNIFLNKYKPENYNTQPKKGEGGSVRDKQNQNQSKINEINLNIHFNKEKPSFDKNELKEFRQRKQIEMEKIQPIDFDNEYSNYSDQESDRLSTLELFKSKKHFILKIMRNKEIHEIKTDEYIKLVSNKKSTEIESKK
ncbi:unnamed protein product [Brachionus calyciflorus]|uniref:Uncharacterized protein n=1 Tax=Brachionus calyciflorus TaxID=104777 RepID=A0A813MFP7_9BILA|nr:unnamed protein product [Brachionus calyciflorus]